MSTPRCGGGVRFYCRFEEEYSQRHLRVQTELSHEDRWGVREEGKREWPREAREYMDQDIFSYIGKRRWGKGSPAPGRRRFRVGGAGRRHRY